MNNSTSLGSHDTYNDIIQLMLQVIKPPTPIPTHPSLPTLFLAGSIEMGLAPPWQRQVEHQLASHNIIIFNPRRDDFDPQAEQKISNPYFYGQVTWELEALERADLIAMYFAPATKAPVTLIEFGLHARMNKLVVCCPPDYWRHGNVAIVCEKHAIPLVTTFDELINLVKQRLLANPQLECQD